MPPKKENSRITCWLDNTETNRAFIGNAKRIAERGKDGHATEVRRSELGQIALFFTDGYYIKKRFEHWRYDRQNKFVIRPNKKPRSECQALDIEDRYMLTIK